MEVQEALEAIAKFKIGETGGELDDNTGQPQRTDDVLIMDIFAQELNVIQKFIDDYNPIPAIPFYMLGGIADGRCPKCNRLQGWHSTSSRHPKQCWYCGRLLKPYEIVTAIMEQARKKK